MKAVEFGQENHEVIILIHGGGLSWWNYKQEADLLSDSYHVVLPILEGHAESGDAFTSIEDCADRIISLIDRRFGGSVFAMGGLSLGAQVLLEILSKRPAICGYAIVESASVIPSRILGTLIAPAFSLSYSLIQKRWFSKMQFRYLRIRKDLFGEYYRDTSKITQANLLAFMKANMSYTLKNDFKKCQTKVRIVVGEKENKNMLRSAKILSKSLPNSILEIKSGLYHGAYSINRPEEYVNDLLHMAER